MFDPVLLADLVMLDDDSPNDMLAQVMNLFVRDTKAGLLEVETTIRAGDLVALRRRLHSIKGAGAQVGALALSDAARSFEAVLKAGGAPDAGWAARLNAEFAAFDAAYQKHAAAQKPA